MKNAKEKAKELVEKFYQLAENIEWTTDNETKQKCEKFNDELANEGLIYWNELAKQCALIALKEMQEVYASVASAIPQLNETKKYRSTYLDEVKEEIEKL